MYLQPFCLRIADGAVEYVCKRKMKNARKRRAVEWQLAVGSRIKEQEGDVGLYLKKISEVRTANREDELVRPKYLALGRERNVDQLLASQQIVQTGRQVSRESVPNQGKLLARHDVYLESGETESTE